MSLIIAGLSIPIQAGFSLRQTLDPIESKTLLRTKNGGGILQTRWKKLGSTISGSGWLPEGLDAINIGAAISISCIEPLSVASASNIITIPRAFRSDANYTPQGAAVVDSQLMPTPLSLVGSVATLTPVVGAVQYHVVYHPIITGFVTISRQFDQAQQLHSWTIDIEEQ